MDQKTTSIGIDHYVYVLARQWKIIAVLTILGGLLGGLFVLVAPREVTATTTINLNVISTEPFSAQKAPSGLLDDETEKAIAHSHVVAVRASDLLDGSMTASEIRQSSSVTTSSGAAVVTVSFVAGDQGDAVKGADAVAEAYLSYRSEQADNRIKVMTENLTERIDLLNEQLDATNEELTSANKDSLEYTEASTERQQILTELDGLLSERNGLQSVDTTAGTVLSEAKDNEVSTEPSMKLSFLTGLGLGLFLGIVAAFVRNPWDRRLRSTQDMTRALKAPVFATVDGQSETIPAVGAAADGLRVARERVLVDVEPGSAVLLIDATHSQDTSLTVLNLAVTTAQAEHPVQLIVPGVSSATRQSLVDALSLQPVDGESGVMGSDAFPTLRYVEAADVDDESQGDLLITRETRRALEEAGPETVTYLVLPSTAHQASLLAGLRVTQALVLVFRERKSLSTEVRWLRDEADGLRKPVLGAVAERRSR